MDKFKPLKKTTNKDKTIITVRIDDDVLETIDMTSGKLNSSRNDFVVQCIDFALDNLELSDDLKK